MFLLVAKSPNLMMSAECTTLTVLALKYMGKYWIVKIFANLMNDAQFAKIFPNNAVKLLLKICHQIHQNIPHYLLYQQRFAKFNPSIFPMYSVQKQTVISMFFLTNLYALGK